MDLTYLPSGHIKLVNALIEHKKAPRTFLIPSGEQLARLKDHEFVKICVAVEKPGISGERIWVHIESIEGDYITGTIDNDPKLIEDLKFGDLVKFSKEYVLSII